LTQGEHAARANLERMLQTGKDGALLRFALGNECLKAGDDVAAAIHLERAVAFEPAYTAAWKLYAKALAQAGRNDEALSAYRKGIAVAQQKGDKQAEKEMLVFARRIERVIEPTRGADEAPT
jgi:Tfp pilus assembly protein PilF